MNRSLGNLLCRIKSQFAVALLAAVVTLVSVETARAQATLQIINNFNNITNPTDPANYFSTYYTDDQVWLYFMNTFAAVTYTDNKGVKQTVQNAQSIQLSNVKDGKFKLAVGCNSTKVYAGLGSSNPFSGTNGPGVFDQNVPYAVAEWTVKGNVYDNADMSYEDSVSFPTCLTIKNAAGVQTDQASFPTGTQAADIIKALQNAMPNAPVGPKNSNYPSSGEVGWGPLVPTVSGKTIPNRWIGSSKFWTSGPTNNLRSMYIYAPSFNDYLQFLKDNEISQFKNGINGWFIDYSGNGGYSGYLSVTGDSVNGYGLNIHDIRVGTNPSAPNWVADPTAGAATTGEIIVAANNAILPYDSTTTVTGLWTDGVIYSGAAMLNSLGSGPVVTGTGDFAMSGAQNAIVSTMLASVSASMATGLLGSDLYADKIKDVSPGATMYWFNTMSRADSTQKLFEKAWAGGQEFYDPFWKVMAELTNMQGYLSPFNDRWSNFSPDFALGANYSITWELGITGSSSTNSISGTVSGDVQNGVTMTLSGASAGTTTTNVAGAYSFANLANGKYVITPSLAGYTFKPTSSSVTISGASQTGENFVATAVVPGTYSISGTITGTVVEDVIVTLSGDSSATTTTDSSGAYSFVNLVDGAYTVTPSLTGYVFVPADLPVTISGANQPGQDFVSNGAKLAYGMAFVIEATEITGLPVPGKFMIKPKVYTKYDTAVKNGLAANATVLTKVEIAGVPSVECLWTKKILLYNSTAFKNAQQQGASAAVWLQNPDNQKDLTMDLRLVSHEANDQSVHPVALAAPVITGITPGEKTEKGNETLVIAGQWFGTKAPRVWREYTDINNQIKQQPMTLLKPTPVDATAGYVDVYGKPAYMNCETGASKAVVTIPTKLPAGKLNGTIVLSNGVGLAVGNEPDN